MLLPYPHIIQGCRPCGLFVARHQGDRCRYSPGTCLVTYNDRSVKKAWRRQQQERCDALDFDELKRHDYETLGSPSAAAGDDRKLPCHFGLASHGLERFPPEIICRAESRSLRYSEAQDGRRKTHNFVARFGASRSNGGTRPFDSKFGQTSHSVKRSSTTAIKTTSSIKTKKTPHFSF